MAGNKPGAWCHIEIPTATPANSKRFYGKVFGWTFRDVPELNYVLFSTGEGEIGGGLWNPPAGMPRQITNYISVEDVDASVARVKQHGGKLVNPKTQVGDHGVFALVADPDGNMLGIWQNLPRTVAKPKKAAKKKSKEKPRKRK